MAHRQPQTTANQRVSWPTLLWAYRVYRFLSVQFSLTSFHRRSGGKSLTLSIPGGGDVSALLAFDDFLVYSNATDNILSAISIKEQVLL